jgi:ribosomal protein S18 acetylase RimI-like enzyme
MFAPAAPDTLITTYLHITDRGAFKPTYLHASNVKIVEMNAADVAFYRFLYGEVGKEWRWRDRLLLSDVDLYAILSQPGVSVHVLYVDGVPAGYVELAKQGDATEIAYFGLRPNFFGRGLGKYLLSYGIETALEDGAERVWVHTCNLDGPHALDNYKKRGFKIYDEHRQPMPNVYQ